MKVFFFSLFYHSPSPPPPPPPLTPPHPLRSHPVFFTLPVSHINNSSKPLFNLTKLATEQHTLPQLTFSYKRKSNKKLIC